MPASYAPDIDLRNCRFVWLGTKKRFPAFTFAFEQTQHGWFQAHAYQYDADTSTFIVETPQHVWEAAGLDRMSQDESIAFCERLFARYLDGEHLISNAKHLRGSAIWIRLSACHLPFVDALGRVRDRDVPVVLIGDAAHTAHFSVGSGTKLALEDGIALAHALQSEPDMRTALATYEAERSVEGAEAAKCGAQLHRVVRARRPLHVVRRAAVRRTACSRAASAFRTRT
jgi:anthraniloyl-CoA monooxygenase